VLPKKKINEMFHLAIKKPSSRKQRTNAGEDVQRGRGVEGTLIHC
jgi:hypothetical protein